MRKVNIPTDEEFAKASASLKHSSRGLNEARNRILQDYAELFNLHEIFIIDSNENTFKTFVFFKNEKDLIDSEGSGLKERIENVIFKELERAGRGLRDNIVVGFEFDSHQNVKKKYGGNYFNRLK